MPIRSWVISLLLGASALYSQRYNFKFYGEEEGLQSLAVQVVFAGPRRLPVGGNAERVVPVRREPVCGVRKSRRATRRPYRVTARID